MRIDPKTASKLDRAGVEFTLAILREEATRHPGNADALGELANLLTRLGRYEEGLAIDLRLAAIQPASPIVFYNLACTCSRLARLDESFQALRRAIELGFDDRDLLLRDEDLAGVRRDRRFSEILVLLEQLKTSR
jgi:tetratricopeptide (TPR) repeat protein